MLNIYYSTKIKKDLKLLKKRKYNIESFWAVVELLANNKALPQKYLDHSLSGNYAGYRECHIEPDWLLIYKITND